MGLLCAGSEDVFPLPLSSDETGGRLTGSVPEMSDGSSEPEESGSDQDGNEMTAQEDPEEASEDAWPLDSEKDGLDSDGDAGVSQATPKIRTAAIKTVQRIKKGCLVIAVPP